MRSHVIRMLCVCSVLVLTGCAQTGNPTAETVPSNYENVQPDIEIIQSTESPEIPAEEEETQRVSMFPDILSFSAETLDGATITESELARADVTAINIWATTCPPCIREMPELAELQASLPENVHFMTWCLDGYYTEDTVRQIMNDSNFMGITIVAGYDDLNNLASSIMYTPTTIFVDSTGHIIGNEIIGAPETMQTYKDGFNTALRQIGKDEIE